MSDEGTLEVIRKFMQAIACAVANVEDLPPGKLATEFTVNLMDEIRSTPPEHFTASQVELFELMVTTLKDDIAEAIENREILKNPQ